MGPPSTTPRPPRNPLKAATDAAARAREADTTLPWCAVDTPLGNGTWYLPENVRESFGCPGVNYFHAKGPPYNCLDRIDNGTQEYMRDEMEEDFQPDTCRLYKPSVQELGELIQNRTFLMIGDSLTRQTMAYLLCDWADFLQAQMTIPEVVPDQFLEPYVWSADKIAKQWTVRDCRTLEWTSTEGAARHVRVCLVISGEHGGPPISHSLPAAVKGLRLGHRDVVVLNQGLHCSDMLPLLIANISAAVSTLNERMGGDAPLFIFRETFPQHFFAEDGWYRKQFRDDLLAAGCRPLLYKANALNEQTTPAVLATRDFHLLFVWEPSAPRWREHVAKPPGQSYTDCTHYCSPSGPLRIAARMLMHHVWLLRP